MNREFQNFSKDLISQLKARVVNITEFGSDRGEANPSLSDIDLFIVAKQKKYRDYIFHIARELEQKHFAVKHNAFTDFLQKHTLLSNDYSGLHLIIIGKEEIDDKFDLKSFRLKFLTSFFISRAILFHNIKYKHRVIFGSDLSKIINIPNLKFQDRLTAFTLPALLLLFLPILTLSDSRFKIWCFKIIKYHSENILVYAQIYYKDPTLTVHNLNLNNFLFEIANKYRYKPHLYQGSKIKLYFQIWSCLLSNFGFLWSGPKLK